LIAIHNEEKKEEYAEMNGLEFATDLLENTAILNLYKIKKEVFIFNNIKTKEFKISNYESDDILNIAAEENISYKKG
jgi:hypothetical protein